MNNKNYDPRAAEATVETLHEHFKPHLELPKARLSGVGLPIAWRVLPKSTKRGNSRRLHRIAPMEEVLSILPCADIRALTMDREFVRGSWLSWLKLMEVPFALSYQWGRKLEKETGIKLKSHGNRAKSVFRQGLESLHRMLHFPTSLATRLADFLDHVVRLPLTRKIVSCDL